MHWEFVSAGRLVFGRHCFSKVWELAREIGTRPLAVTGSRMQLANSFVVTAEPSLDTVRAGVAHFHAGQCDSVVAIGGGSVLDAGKAIAALAANSGEPLDYLEIVGQGRRFERDAYPVLAVPTTAGTGSEVTRNAVLGCPEHGVKASLRSASMIPKIAVIDAELTLSLPPELTASTGMDALTQLIEPFVSAKANPFTDTLCREGIRLGATALRRAYHHGDDVNARTDMAFVSTLGGLALANAGLGAAHGFAAPLGAMFGAPHGALCAAMLPHVMRMNIEAGGALERYAEVARILTGTAEPMDGVRWVSDLVKELEIPSLRTYGASAEHVESVVEKASHANSMKANPVALSSSQLKQIYEAAL